MDLELTNRVAIVTGGGSGIGRAACEAFSRDGAKVVVTDVDDKGGAETVSIIEKAPARSLDT